MKMKLIQISLLATILSGCSTGNSSHKNLSQSNVDVSKQPTLTKQNQTKNLVETNSKKSQILALSHDIQQALATQNYSAIASHIHPIKGVRFSMYAYVQPEQDKVFSRQQFAKYLQQDRIKFTWGITDGRGDLYIATLPDYLNKWVDAEQYNGSTYPNTITFNEPQGSGNSINNLTNIYPNADFVEFYHAGTEQYAGIDWHSLRLVFEPYQGHYYLVAIVNDQWTV